MALIKCPECGNDVSSYAKQCIHCGFPLDMNEKLKENITHVNETNENRQICIIDGRSFDLTDVVNDIMSSDYNNLDCRDKLNYKVFEIIGIISIYDAEDIVEYIINHGNAPKTIKSTAITNAPIISMADTKIRCPKCGSTQITAGARGVNAVWGFIGASKTVNRCMSCGYSWTPKKR